MKALHLDSLDRGIPAITKRQAGSHMEACVWCLSECGHRSGVTLTIVDRGDEASYQLLWPQDQIDLAEISRAYNQGDGPEHGAEAIALLLIRDRTEYTAVRRSVVSTGIDYWLGFKDDMPSDNFFGKMEARLEVSAILRRTDSNTVRRRMRKKMSQSQQSDSTALPAFVIVVEFSQPLAEVTNRYV